MSLFEALHKQKSNLSHFQPLELNAGFMFVQSSEMLVNLMLVEYLVSLFGVPPLRTNVPQLSIFHLSLRKLLLVLLLSQTMWFWVINILWLQSIRLRVQEVSLTPFLSLLLRQI